MRKIGLTLNFDPSTVRAAILTIEENFERWVPLLKGCANKSMMKYAEDKARLTGDVVGSEVVQLQYQIQELSSQLHDRLARLQQLMKV